MLTEFHEFMKILAEESGRVIRSHLDRPELEVRLKDDDSPVTEADREAERKMRAMIRGRFPEHGVIGEEFGSENEGAEFVWTLDPIDGTLSFASGCPLFGTLIGLLHEGRPVLGAIHQPILQELCIGDGRETRLNDRPVRVREHRRLSDATLLTTDVKYIGRYQNQLGFDNLVADTGLFRTWGDCYGYLLVATGRADIMLDPIMNPWDLAPLIPVIEGAGGVITSWTGGAAYPGTSSVAAGPALHPQVIGRLNP